MQLLRTYGNACGTCQASGYAKTCIVVSNVYVEVKLKVWVPVIFEMNKSETIITSFYKMTAL